MKIQNPDNLNKAAPMMLEAIQLALSTWSLPDGEIKRKMVESIKMAARKD